ncbi:MAG: DUF3078 domain-containing protein [Cryomorphaceae bacterium]|jgi:hypothetical protein|nr:MAG: DUF3078 domain-containing protein [Cryomorphaceae bacterium]|tara:strand:+ start:1704 stop:2603 length:900 start_codon:yes stop_codon:yes gene_type:complete
MNRSILFLIIFFNLINLHAQKEIKKDSLETNWNLSGKFTFLGNQSSYSYWTAGGQTSVSGTIKIDYDFNYDKDGWNWDTKLITAYGLNSIGGSKFLKKTDDKLEINSLFGKKFTNNLIGNWSYSSFINFKTQWTKGYRFRKNSQGEEERTELTRFFSPAYLQVGVGLYWKKNKDFWINMAPFTGRLIIVNRYFTNNLEDNKRYFGVKKGKNSRFELGASIRSFFKFELVENVFVTNRISLYSDYLDNPANIDLDYTINTVMKVNKYLTTNLIIQFIYDHNSVKRLQVREVMGIGISLDI